MLHSSGRLWDLGPTTLWQVQQQQLFQHQQVNALRHKHELEWEEEDLPKQLGSRQPHGVVASKNSSWVMCVTEEWLWLFQPHTVNKWQKMLKGIYKVMRYVTCSMCSKIACLIVVDQVKNLTYFPQPDKLKPWKIWKCQIKNPKKLECV